TRSRWLRPAGAACKRADSWSNFGGFAAETRTRANATMGKRRFGARPEAHGGGMDLLEAKSRIAEALVESIFRRARYDVAPFRREKSSPLRFGREDFSPDFRISQRLDAGEEHEYLVEVKYRPSAGQFISVENQRGARSLFHMMRRHWPQLYFILVTERPDEGRSCFQALAFETVRQ